MKKHVLMAQERGGALGGRGARVHITRPVTGPHMWYRGSLWDKYERVSAEQARDQWIADYKAGDHAGPYHSR